MNRPLSVLNTLITVGGKTLNPSQILQIDLIHGIAQPLSKILGIVLAEAAGRHSDFHSAARAIPRNCSIEASRI
jgi:hypothetical protein